MKTTNTSSYNEKALLTSIFPSSDDVQIGWEDTDYANPSIPSTLSDMKEQIRISEEQIDNGQYVTAQKAIEHFNQL